MVKGKNVELMISWKQQKQVELSLQGKKLKMDFGKDAR